MKIWKGALRELKERWDIIGGFDNEMFWKTLQISYNHLFLKNQDMFLDIVFLFCWFQKKYILSNVLEWRWFIKPYA